ncbi:DUF1638 domain-containing protein [Methanosalsum zhilinae]|nr:DUF1638 domain-containing protein [Methanosalsum zhilinae]
MESSKSSTLGIILCKIFEDELVHLIKNGPSPDEVVVIENDDSAGFINKLKEEGIVYAAIDASDVSDYLEKNSGNGFVLVVNILELALHAYPDDLKETVYSTIENMAGYCNGIFLLYGLCGNVLVNVEEDFESCDYPVKILRDNDGVIVDDCIGATLGGRKEYLRTLKNCRGSGTFFLTPMWAANWRELARSAGMCQDPYDDATSKFVFEQVGYNTVGKINTGLNYEKDFDKKVEEFASIFEFKIVEMNGSPELFEECYKEMLELLNMET